MSKLSELAAAENQPPNPHQCHIFKIMRVMSEQDVADLNAVLADDGLMGSAIARALTKLGHPVRGNSVQRHRNGLCRCPR